KALEIRQHVFHHLQVGLEVLGQTLDHRFDALTQWIPFALGLLVQPMAAVASSFNRRRAGWPRLLKKVLSSTATFSMGICSRAISAFMAAGNWRSSRINSNSMATRLITSSSTGLTRPCRPAC